MKKTIDLKKDVYSLCEEYPELVDIMVSLGFAPMANPEVRNTAGRIMTIPKGAEMMNVPMATIISALEEGGFAVTGAARAQDEDLPPRGHEAGHTFLARMGKTRLRPGGVEATQWLLDQASFNKETRVLEVACNMGTTMIQIAEEYGCEVTGLDVDANALEKARENVQEHHLEHVIHLVKGSAFELPFADDSFDVLINEAMLTMLRGEAKDKALSEYARVLKPGGILLTQDVCLYAEDPEELKELTTEISRVINVHVEPLTKRQWKERFEGHGFCVTTKDGAMSLLDPEGLLRDEGEERTLQILSNGTQRENASMFMGMFEFFNEHKEDFGYIAVAGVKPKAE